MKANQSLKTRQSPASRFTQYGLRALFALVLVAALPAWRLRIELDELAAEHDAIAKLRAAGALVEVELAEPRWLWERLPKSVAPHPEHAVRFEASDYQGPIAAREMLLVARLSYLKQLTLRNLSLGDDDLAACAGLTRLEDLKIRNCRRLTSRAAHYFRNAAELRHLDLTATPIDDVALGTLSNFEQLEDLDLSFTNVTDAGMAHVGRLTDLKRLTLPRGGTSRGLRQIERLESLGNLSIYLHAGDDAETLLCISRLPTLRSLQFHGELSDAGFAVLAKEQRLHRLSIHGDGFTQTRTTWVRTSSSWNKEEHDWVYAHGFSTRFTPTTSAPSQAAPAPQRRLSSDTSASAHKLRGQPQTLSKEQSDDPQNDQTKPTRTMPAPSGAGGGGARAPLNVELGNGRM